MVNVKKDLTGKLFTRLKVICQTDDYVYPNGRREAKWLCECQCEEKNLIAVRQSDLKRGHTRSCGCLIKDETIASNKVAKKKYNQYKTNGDVVIGLTYNTNKEFYVDKKNFNIIKDICWCETNQNGFCRLMGRDTKTGKNVLMHQLLGFANYDHIDHNELNNLENNLRPATSSQNSQNRGIQSNNTSGVIGVSWFKNEQKWIARIKLQQRSIYLGSFANKNDAIIARLCAEQKYFGEFAPQKHLYEQYGIKENME